VPTCGGRRIDDGKGNVVVSVHSTYREGGDVDPSDADAIGRVLAKFVASPHFAEAFIAERMR
jgi:hypothetical protein